MAWEWNGETCRPASSIGEINGRGLPIYVDGMLITMSGPRRTVVSLDPATGKTLWTFQEPTTPRHDYSMRSNHGKGVAYHAHQRPRRGARHDAGLLPARARRQDRQADRGLGRRGAGRRLRRRRGSVDMLKDLIADWEPWRQTEQKYDAAKGLPLELGYITTSSPPIVVNDVLVVGNSAEQGYNQTRVENVPGRHPRPTTSRPASSCGSSTSSRGRASSATRRGRTTRGAGPATCRRGRRCRPIRQRGLVYIPTNGATIDYYGGFRPGDNLFSTSVIALDVKTGKRVWHQQLVKHDIWNYDTPTAPILLDVNVGGRRIPGLFQITKQSLRLLLQPPHRRADLADGDAAGAAVEGAGREAVDDAAAPDQAGAVRSAGPQGRGPHRLHAGDQEAGARARAGARPAAPTLRAAAHRGNAEGKGPANICPGGGGGANITGPPAADPAAGIIFVTSTSGCSPTMLAPAKERDNDKMTGKTLRRSWARGGGGDGRRRRRSRPERSAARAFPISSRDRSAASSPST